MQERHTRNRPISLLIRGKVRKRLTLKITALILVATLALLLVVVPAVKAWALEWWEPTFHLDNRTAAQKAADEKELREWLTEYNKGLQEIECLVAHQDEPVADQKAACLPPEMPIEQQLQNAREATSLAAQNPPCKLKNFTGGIITSEELTERCNTDENILRNMTTIANKTTTVDDGYVYPKNATNEEKSAIDAQEYEAWLKAGKPGAQPQQQAP